MDFFRFWKVPDRLEDNPDSLIVLSYAVKGDLTPTRPTKAIIDLAVSLWQKNRRTKIIMSTGDNQKLGVTNARIMKEYAISRGVPAEVILEENFSLDTVSNLTQSYRICRTNRFIKPMLVLYDLHVRRTLAAATKLGLNKIYWISCKSPGEPAYGWKQFQTYSRTTIFLYEILASFYYLITGKISLKDLRSLKRLD
jgi:uncharacterized SAM-binding protein YcdF (DUF218 family)